MKKYSILIALALTELLTASPFPICFSIPEVKVVSEIPQKDKDFAFLIPKNLSTYIYNKEQDYYKDYQRSYFAITRCKGGWDCLRHYEILANGCVPYFLDLESCPNNTMHLLPKHLILEAMQLPGVSQGNIDHTKFDYKRYYEIAHELLEYTRKHLTTKSIAQYVLDTIAYKGNGNILLLSDNPSPHYIQICLLIGLRELFHDKVTEFPKLDYIYKSYKGDIKRLYGKGFSYTRIIEDYHVDRHNIENRIENREFDLIIYPIVHGKKPFYETVKKYYQPEEIVYVCGEDAHDCAFRNLHNLFLREWHEPDIKKGE